MSVMDKLKAIRGRLSAQSAEFEVAHAGRSAGHPADNDFWFDETAPEATAETGRSPADMWDLASDPEPAKDAPAMPEEALDSSPRLLAFPAPPTPAAAPAPASAAPERKPEAPPAPTWQKPSATPKARYDAESGPDQARRGGRVKTRLLGIDHSNGHSVDFDRQSQAATARPIAVRFPVGWLIVVDGPGRGTSFALTGGVSQIGRGEDQAVQLDFGDSTISRANHAAVAFDEETCGFFIGHGGKSNLVRLNGKPLLSTEALKHGDEIVIGETTLRLVALCGDAFCWAERAGEPNAVTG
jgi:hypothetical protein